MTCSIEERQRERVTVIQQRLCKYCHSQHPQTRRGPVSHLHKCQSYAACTTNVAPSSAYLGSQNTRTYANIHSFFLYSHTTHAPPLRPSSASKYKEHGTALWLALLDLRFISKLNFSTDYVYVFFFSLSFLLFIYIYKFFFSILGTRVVFSLTRLRLLFLSLIWLLGVHK